MSSARPEITCNGGGESFDCSGSLHTSPESVALFELQQEPECSDMPRGFDSIHAPRLSVRRWLRDAYVTPCSKPGLIWDTILGFVPILRWLPEYKLSECIVGDLMAGITAGVMHVPQGIAYALLSGVKPIHGLYMSMLAPFFYMLFGTSRHVSVGSFAVVALMTGVANQAIMDKYHGDAADDVWSLEDYSTYTVNPIAITATLAFTIGLCQLAVVVLRLDFIESYFSDALVGGFTTGAAVHVFVSQMDDIMGIKLERVSGPGYLFVVVYRLALASPRSNLCALSVSVVTAVALMLAKDYATPAMSRRLGKKITIPFEVIALIATTVVTHVFQLKERYGMFTVGNVPAGFPTPQLPVWQLIPDCLQTAIAITVVTLAVHITMAKMLARRLNYDIDARQEVYATSFTSLLTSFFPVYPPSTGLGRTMVHVEAGMKTQLAALFTTGFLLMVILFIGPYFYSLPLCVLSTIIIVSLRPLFRNFGTLPALWQVSRIDVAIWLVTFTTTVAIDVIGGLGIGLAFALFTVVLRTQQASWQSRISRPALAPDGRAIKRICIFRFEAFLLFTNAESFKQAAHETLRHWITRMPLIIGADEKGDGFFFVFDCSALCQIDAQGIAALSEVLDDIQRQSAAQVFFTNASADLEEQLLGAKVVGAPEAFYSSVDDFLVFMNYRSSTLRPIDEDNSETPSIG